MRTRASAAPLVDMGDIYRALDPVLEAIERHRRGHLWFLLLAVPVICIPAAIGFGAWTLVETRSIEIACIGGIGAAIAGAIGIYRLLENDYRHVCKRRFNSRLAAALNLKYLPRGSFNMTELHPHYIFPSYARALPEDNISFVHNKRRVEIQEVIFNQSPSDTNHLFNPFRFTGKRGLIIKVPSRRPFAVHTVVVPKRFVASDRGRARFMGLQNYERAPFGNRQFSKKYYVMSMASDEAHLIFDPAFIERIFEFEKSIGARSLSFSFRQDDIMIYADHAHDFLEAGHLLEPISFAHADKIIHELQALTGLIDALELNAFVGV
jgi:hypothetical protein